MSHWDKLPLDIKKYIFSFVEYNIQCDKKIKTLNDLKNITLSIRHSFDFYCHKDFCIDLYRDNRKYGIRHIKENIVNIWILGYYYLNKNEISYR